MSSSPTPSSALARLAETDKAERPVGLGVAGVADRERAVGDRADVTRGQRGGGVGGSRGQQHLAAGAAIRRLDNRRRGTRRQRADAGDVQAALLELLDGAVDL